MKATRDADKFISDTTLINTLDSLISGVLAPGSNSKFSSYTEESDNAKEQQQFTITLDTLEEKQEVRNRLRENGIEASLSKKKDDRLKPILFVEKKSVEAFHAYQSGLAAEEENNFVRAEHAYKRAAELGNIKAKTSLAMLYLLGKEGVKQDKARAYELMLEAAKAGHARAQFNLGRMCERGDGVKVDLQLAMRWYGEAYKNGVSTAKDDYERVENKRDLNDSLLADQKKINTTINANKAAEFYKKGMSEDHKHNAGKAAAYYQRAVHLGHLESKVKLAFHFLKGTGGAIEDKERAFSLYGQAAMSGHPKAQFNLATMFEDGVGTKEDLQQAKHWYEQALKNGITFAKDDIARIDGKLSSPAVTETETISKQVTSRLESPQNKTQPYTIERTMGFFNPANYESAKKILEKAGWNVPDVRGRKESTPIVVTKDKEQFSISPGKFTTDSTNQSTFEAMLQAFKASNPNVTPVITTNNEENKGVWIKAYNQVYKDKPAPTIVIENSAPSKDKGNEQSSPDAGSRRPN